MKISSLIMNKIFSRYVGKDVFGNRYYVSKLKNCEGYNTRSVIYNGVAEPSKVPPLWHAWLHYMTNQLPTKKDTMYEWQQDFVPNLTGTSYAYFPKGHPNRGGKTPKKWYRPWTPN